MRILRTVASAVVAVMVVASPAQAHDSLSPRGAPHAWLPANESWVMQHWLPFDEVRLYRALDIDNLALERWLRDDHRTIAMLAQQRKGVTAGALADHLVAQWAGRVSDEQLAVLRERTMRVVTQGHLSQHVLFHYFHGTYTLENTRVIFGVDRRRYTRMRLRGSTPFQIGRRGGRTPARVARGMRRILRYGMARGVETGSHSPAQGAYMLERREALLPCFLRRPMPKLDSGNPYGDPHNGHGRHSRAERNGVRAASKQARARRRKGSCWHEPALPSVAAADRLIEP